VKAAAISLRKLKQQASFQLQLGTIRTVR